MYTFGNVQQGDFVRFDPGIKDNLHKIGQMSIWLEEPLDCVLEVYDLRTQAPINEIDYGIRSFKLRCVRDCGQHSFDCFTEEDYNGIEDTLGFSPLKPADFGSFNDLFRHIEEEAGPTGYDLERDIEYIYSLITSGKLPAETD